MPVLKQYLPNERLAKGIGSSYTEIIRALTYWSVVSGVIVLVLGWDSSIGTFARSLFPWMTFPWFLTAVVAGFAIVIAVDFLFIWPSVVAYNNRQSVEHDNPIYKKLVEMEKENRKTRRSVVLLRRELRDLRRRGVLR